MQMRQIKKDQKTENRKKLLDFQAINPCYQGAMASDVVRALITSKVAPQAGQAGEEAGRTPRRCERTKRQVILRCW